VSKFVFWIRRLLGTPNEETWPGVSKLRDWHEYPQWQYADISKAVPHLDPKGVDLLSVSLLLLTPPWFMDLTPQHEFPYLVVFYVYFITG
jgi:cyclin-dependent kinase